jgi:hypothetical protein
MGERGVTSDDESVSQERGELELDEGGREAILSVIDDATSIGEVQRLAGGPQFPDV